MENYRILEKTYGLSKTYFIQFRFLFIFWFILTDNKAFAYKYSSIEDAREKIIELNTKTTYKVVK